MYQTLDDDNDECGDCDADSDGKVESDNDDDDGDGDDDGDEDGDDVNDNYLRLHWLDAALPTATSSQKRRANNKQYK